MFFDNISCLSRVRDLIRSCDGLKQDFKIHFGKLEGQRSEDDSDEEEYTGETVGGGICTIVLALGLFTVLIFNLVKFFDGSQYNSKNERRNRSAKRIQTEEINLGAENSSINFAVGINAAQSFDFFDNDYIEPIVYRMQIPSWNLTIHESD